jgi:hypothetical protein
MGAVFPEEESGFAQGAEVARPAGHFRGVIEGVVLAVREVGHSAASASLRIAEPLNGPSVLIEIEAPSLQYFLHRAFPGCIPFELFPHLCRFR